MKKNTIGCLFYVAVVLLILVLFLFNRSTVQDVLEKTGFLKLFQKNDENPPEIVISPIEKDEEHKEPVEREKEKEKEKEIVVEVNEKPAVSEEKPQPRIQAKIRKARLFFITITGEGEVDLKGVVRSIEYTDAPLTSALEILLKGPLPAEINNGYRTMLSPDIRIQNIYIKNDVAYIDFNEAFRFNTLGREGLLAQLKQVVYTVTEFSNIKKVQIMIESKKSEYLGPEGIYIGKPLSRDSFRS